jgi:hypothetical protein
MSQDARNSLIALASVSAIFGLFYLLMWWIPDGLKLPYWVGPAGLALALSISMMRALAAFR